MTFSSLPDTTPIIVGAAQHSEDINAANPRLSAPMDLAEIAAKQALTDAGIHFTPADIDCIAMVRKFSDTAPAWKSPFGGSNNPPGSLAYRIGANPSRLIYSASAGTQPMELLTEAMCAIARGEITTALITGCEAIANQRYAQRNGIELDWNEQNELRVDKRHETSSIHSPEELAAGLYMPLQVYALIENLRAHQRGQNRDQLDRAMGQLLAPFSEVASKNPHAVRKAKLSAEDIISSAKNNYELSLPYRKLQVSQDAVNQSAAILVTSVGEARKKGIDESRWVFVQAYAYGQDIPLTQRADPARSEAMTSVLRHAVEQAGLAAKDFDHIDLYSCFPCAVDAACEILDLPTDGSIPLTVTGGLPYFGGPGNNYCTHALAEMIIRLRGTNKRGLITANGGALSKHAAIALGTSPGSNPPDWRNGDFNCVNASDIAAVDYCPAPGEGTILTYTLIPNRKGNDRALVIAENGQGQRFLAHSEQAEECKAVAETNPIGRTIEVINSREQSHQFRFA